MLDFAREALYHIGIWYLLYYNLIYLFGCFDSKVKIIWLWLLSVWCIFWLPNVC